MRPPTASEHIGAARAKLQLAIQLSGAADLAVLQHILDLMEATKSEMYLAEAAIRQGAPDERTQLRREAALLQREIGSMMRVVDGCAALHRGLSVQFGATSSSYTSQGRPVPAALISAACEMQG
jgi:hypothetical protein